MNIFIKAFVSVIILLFGIVGWVVLNTMSPKPEIVEYKPQTPPVTVMTAKAQTVSIPVYSRGIVSPGTELQIATEIAGRVEKVSPNFANGGFFKKDELLLEVDATRYKLEITKAKARLLTVQQVYERLIANQGLDDDEVNGIKRSTKFKQSQREEAEAKVLAAKADVTIANNQIAKAKVYAPFDGRVREAFIGKGQYVSPGMQIARVYAVDKAEVRLPLSDHQLSLVNAPVRYQGEEAANEGPPVTMQLEYAGQNFLWTGKVVRTEGGIDMRNRLMYVVARVDGPYERDPDQPGRPPLSAGQFIEAQVKGKQYSDIVVLPRKVLSNGDNVWIVDQDERLQKKNVNILHKGRELIYLAGGLKPGDQVVVTRLDVAIEGMKVRSTHEDNLDIVDAGSKVVADTKKFSEVGTAEVDDLWEVKASNSSTLTDVSVGTDKLANVKLGAKYEPKPANGNQYDDVEKATAEIKKIEQKGESKVKGDSVSSTKIAKLVKDEGVEEVSSILDRIAAKAEKENRVMALKAAKNSVTEKLSVTEKPIKKVELPATTIDNDIISDQHVAINNAQINSAQINSAQINSAQINSAQINNSQVKSPVVNSPQTNSHANDLHVNSTGAVEASVPSLIQESAR